MDWGNKREERMGCSQPCCPSVVSEFRDPMDCSLPGSSVHGILQVRILEWVAISFSRGSSWLKDGTCTSCFGSWILYHPATRESPIFSLGSSKVKRLQGGQLLRVSAVHGVAAPDLFCRSPPPPPPPAAILLAHTGDSSHHWIRVPCCRRWEPLF